MTFSLDIAEQVCKNIEKQEFERLVQELNKEFDRVRNTEDEEEFHRVYMIMFNSLIKMRRSINV